MSQIMEPCTECEAVATVTLEPYGSGTLAVISCPNCGESYDTNLDPSEHSHLWRSDDGCCAWCPICDAESYHGEIIKEGSL